MARQTPTRPLLLAALLPLLSACAEGQSAADTGPAPEPRAAEPQANAPSAPQLPAAPAPSAPASASIPAPSLEVKPPPGPRVFSKARFAWIQSSPSHGSGWQGYLSLGDSVALAGKTAEESLVPGGLNCTWYRVAPRGFMCAGGAASTLDGDDPLVKYLARYAPDESSPWPYRYGESTGLHRYETLPDPKQQRRFEWDLDEHLAAVARAREATSETNIDKDLVGVDLTPAKNKSLELLPVGPLVREVRDRIIPQSTVAYVDELEDGGRSWLLTWDHALVPKDRVRPYPKSDFSGVALEEGKVELPIAFIRKKARPKYTRAPDGTMIATDREWPRLAWFRVSGEPVVVDNESYWQTSEDGVFVRDSDATIAKRDTPFPKMALESKGRKTWVEVSILGGWLIAYEGEKPVFVTLISPGRGGLPAPNRDALETASTPVGTFRVDGKFVTATMVSSTDDLIVHTEVQYVQNFHGPHALHGAYWHDAWGEPKSGGCVNLAPRDAAWLFEFSEPSMPEGWHGMRAVKDAGPSTIVVVHR